MKRFIGIAVAAATVTSLIGSPASADGGWSEPYVSEPIVEGLAGPLSLALGHDGSMFVSQAFAGKLSKVNKWGELSDVAMSPDPNATIMGVYAENRGKAIFTVSGFNPETNDWIGLVQRVRRNGKVATIGDPGTVEETQNPDQNDFSGFLDLDDDCAALVPPDVGGGFPIPSEVDTNSYALTKLRNGKIVVADAGANDLVLIDKKGNASVLAVFPPLGFPVDADTAAAFGIPDCAVGHSYYFQPVPTDVELGPDGMLYVSLLPGGPEDDSAGARGAIMQVNPRNGKMKQIASGFLGAVDLAVAKDGTIYVAEIFGNRISKVVGSGAETVVELNQPGAIEYQRGELYVTINATSFSDTGDPLGAIVKVIP